MPRQDSAIATLRALHDKAIRSIADDNGTQIGRHLWKQAEIDALTLALAARRPLLVRGEPGTGKTQLAYAIASLLGWRLHAVTIHARYEAHDLLCQFDAVARLADAQAECLKEDKVYWRPGPLWRALDWRGALGFGPNPQPADTLEPAGHVVLIDEIDKADSDLPNSLLDIFGSRRLDIPPLTQPLRIADDAWPLILITTNEERDLPPAFLRRCVVLSHDLPEDTAYVDYLLEHGRAHFRQETDSAPLDEGLMRAAAEQLRSDRRHTLAAHLPPPGLAEYLDLLRALQDLAPGNLPRQQAMFAALNRYTYLKHRVEDDKASAIRQQRPNFAKDQPAS